MLFAEDILNTNFDGNGAIPWTRKATAPTVGLLKVYDASGGLADLEVSSGIAEQQGAPLSKKRKNFDLITDGNLEIRQGHSLIAKPKPSDRITEPSKAERLKMPVIADRHILDVRSGRTNIYNGQVKRNTCAMSLIISMHFANRKCATESRAIDQTQAKLRLAAKRRENTTDPTESNGHDKNGKAYNSLVLVRPFTDLRIEIYKKIKHVKNDPIIWIYLHP
ncbi:MAG: hypothetical protein U1F76_08750 [Candidatus Competibacteraceae bacterium]